MLSFIKCSHLSNSLLSSNALICLILSFIKCSHLSNSLLYLLPLCIYTSLSKNCIFLSGWSNHLDNKYFISKRSALVNYFFLYYFGHYNFSLDIKNIQQNRAVLFPLLLLSRSCTFQFNYSNLLLKLRQSYCHHCSWHVRPRHD